MTKFEMANELVSLLNANGFSAFINNEHQEVAPFIEASKDGFYCEEIYIHDIDFSNDFAANEYLTTMQKEVDDKINLPKLSEEDQLNALFN